jgi:RNA polymerase sigma-70 factor (ECF subfamily)
VLAHDSATSYEQTDWAYIVALYSTLARVEPRPVIELNLAAAEAETFGPERGLRRMALLDKALATYPYLHASRAELLRRLGRDADAAVAYERALELTGNASERRFLEERLDAVTSDARD